jgi:glycosyltransferase involved in cell wall biosynthesis
MKILFLTLAKIDSIEDRAIYPDLLRKFRNEGHEIFILSPTERKFKKNTELIIERGSHILKIWTTNIQKTNVIEKVISTLMIEFLFLRAINKYFKEEKFDLILYSTPPITFTNLIIKIKTKTSSITYLLLKDIFPQNAVDLKMFSKQSLIYKYFRRKEKLLYKISDHIGCMSEFNKKYVLAKNPSLSEAKIEVNPNSMYIVPKSDELKTILKSGDFLPKDKVVFVYGGNLGKPQGVDFLLDIINVSKSNTKAFFVIIGSGTESQRVRTWFNKNKPENALLFDHLPQAEYDTVLRSCDVGLVFLNPAFSIPNYPSRILNYMDNKLPILFGIDKSTDVGKEAEAGNYGLSCENGDLSAFIKYIDILSNDEGLRKKMGNNGYKKLKQDFNVDYSYELIMSHLPK